MSETSKDTENLGGESALARPYARAVFELAKAQGDYAKWTDDLALVAAVVSNDSMQSLLVNPRLTRTEAAGLVIRACGDDIGEGAINLLKMLAENDRLRTEAGGRDGADPPDRLLAPCLAENSSASPTARDSGATRCSARSGW